LFLIIGILKRKLMFLLLIQVKLVMS
jgi:hypothetical protein